MNAVVQGGDVGRALDGSVAAQRHDATARTPNVAQQELQQGTGADHLRPIRVLSPTHRVGPSCGAVAAGVGEQGFGHPDEGVARTSGDLFHHLWGVAPVVTLEDLEYRARVL